MLRALVKKKKKKKAYIVYSQIDIMTGSAYINAINQENYMHELHISVFLLLFYYLCYISKERFFKQLLYV